MHRLTFVVNGQNLVKLKGFDGLVAGTKGHLQAHFTFTGDWSGLRKVAVFTCRSGEYPVLITNNTCMVPDEVAACESFKVHIVGKLLDGGKLPSSRVTVIQRRH